MLQFADSTFSDTFITTVGIDYKYKYLDAVNEKTGKNERIRLEIWDTAGQERFKAITRSYLRGAEGVVLVYDITDPKSFENVENWTKQINQFATDVCDKVLVGNKCDLESGRKVSTDQGKEMASTHGIEFFEASAKTNLNIDKCFETLAHQVLKRKVFEKPAKSTTRLNQTGKSGCC